MLLRLLTMLIAYLVLLTLHIAAYWSEYSKSLANGKDFEGKELLPESSKSLAKKHFEDVGLLPDKCNIDDLPTNEVINSLYGRDPIVVDGAINGKQCQKFIKQVTNPQDRWIGVAGLFNTGTNLLHDLLSKNCMMPAQHDSILWQVPWGKHAFATLSRKQTANTMKSKEAVKDNGLVVVAVRNPYAWARSMCKNPYAIKWEDTDVCPNSTAKVLSWGGHENLYAFYNSWYAKYWKEFPYPRIFVRLEDLTLRPKETIQMICNCAGGNTTVGFQHIVVSAKDSSGHRSTTGIVKAWENVVSSEVYGGLSIEDYTIARKQLNDGGLMQLFSYKHPPSIDHGLN